MAQKLPGASRIIVIYPPKLEGFPAEIAIHEKAVKDDSN